MRTIPFRPRQAKRLEVPPELDGNSSPAPIEPMVASSAGPVLEEGKDPFLLLAKEVEFGV